MDAIAGELEELAMDPALESCCRRDLEQQAASARLRSKLMIQDRTMVRLKAQSAVFAQPVPGQAAVLQQAGFSSDSGFSSDLDDAADPGMGP